MPTRPHVQKLAERTRMKPPLAAAVVFPCDADALQLALSGAFAGYITPTLVGPEPRIRDLANRFGLDISRLSILDTPDEPRAASDRAVALARDGKVSALIKGSLRNEDLLAPVALPDSGLRTEHRLSHAYFVDLPGQNRGLLVADAQLNVNPNLAAKRDIVANTVGLAQAIGIAAPHVAILAALDGPSPAFPSTTDAVALKQMALQGVFGSALVDGPLTPDVALDAETARSAGAKSEVAGRADVVIAPTMEAAIMLLRSLTGVTHGLAAGIVLGAKVPIVAPSRHDSMEVRMASCVIASLAAAAREAQTPQHPAPEPRPTDNRTPTRVAA
jgi:phosphate acetyltransferase